MTLFHFSDDPSIAAFVPRSVRVPAVRRPGMEWLNGPLVWAIDGWHAPLYLFPRECPRILVWRTPRTTQADAAAWFGGCDARMIAFLPRDREAAFRRYTLYRYALPSETFEAIGDAGMHVAREAVVPDRMDSLDDLAGELAAEDVTLRLVDSLLPLRTLWSTTLHASGIRLRNVAGWGEPGWPHSRPPPA